jgi:hypothetical protein
MNVSRQKTCTALLTLFFTALCLTLPSYAQNQKGESQRADHAKTPPLRSLPPMDEDRHDGHHDKPLRLTLQNGAAATRADGALQTTPGPAVSVGNIFSFDGLGVGGGYTPNAAPPDTNGAVGATQYVQWVNESFAVYDKATGAKLYGPAAGNTLFQALGATHPCAVNNDGDPIAQYDKAANRWVLTQFSVTSGSSKGYWQCVAVSQTSDATGAYNVYAFNYGTVQFNDYPKLGVWSNGYYITFNIFNNGNTFAGSKLCAYDRSAMLAGTAANQVCFQLSSAFGGVLPADIDGNTAPPAGAPETFVAFGTNVLQVWHMSNVNFSGGTATLTGPTNIAVAAFSAACSGGGTCIPQGGTTQKLDSLADRLMYRLAYRNFGDHESLVVNHAVTAGTSVGTRWYELRNVSTTPTLYQQGTYAPDVNYRWMGSAALDHDGNLAVAYSLSSSTLHPSIRFAARAPGDALGTLGAELVIKDGAGSQTTGLSRWGDYSSISVDPVDDCTLWYTTEYQQTNGTFNWSTRIANFKLGTCGAVATPDYSIAATPASQSVLQGGGTSYTATVTPSNGFTGTVSFSVAGLPSGATAAFNPTSVTTSGSTTMSVTTAAATPSGSYPLTITGTSGSLSHSTNVTLVVNSAGDFSVAASPASQTVTAGAGTTYSVSEAGSGGFNGTVNFSVSGLPTGASASFNPTSVVGSGSSTLTVNTTTSTAAGTYTLTVTGASGSLSHSTTVTLVVNPAPNPDFTITASPTSRTVGTPGTTTYTVTIAKVNGFNGVVSLSVTGLPSRTTGSFSPTSVTGSGTSTLTISTRSRTAIGSFVLTIKGTSGTLSHSTTVSLTTN